ncbi:MAG: hypothetical protein AB1791_05640 [Chloroflexota bacterium]
MRAMRIDFYDDPLEAPRSREEVRIRRLSAQVYPDGRRVAITFDLTPFLERPSLAVTLTNAQGEAAGSMTVIETLDRHFSLTLHIRDKDPAGTYRLDTFLYYNSPETGKVIVDSQTTTFNIEK